MMGGFGISVYSMYISKELSERLVNAGLYDSNKITSLTEREVVKQAKLTKKMFEELRRELHLSDMQFKYDDCVDPIEFYDSPDVIKDVYCGGITDIDDFRLEDEEDEEDYVYPGKRKCELLKQIRREIAEANNIVYLTAECTHKGPCKGTCPACDAEIKYLENELNEKAARGEKIKLTGISLDSFEDYIDEDADEDYPDEGSPKPVMMGKKMPRR